MNGGSSTLELLLAQGLLLINELLRVEVTGAGKSRERKWGAGRWGPRVRRARKYKAVSLKMHVLQHHYALFLHHFLHCIYHHWTYRLFALFVLLVSSLYPLQHTHLNVSCRTVELISILFFPLLYPRVKNRTNIYVAQTVKNLPAAQETWVQSLVWENPLEKGMAIHSIILAWRIQWTEEPGGLQSMVLQRVRHVWATNTAIW